MSQHKSLFPISMSTLLPGATIGIDIFVRSAPGLPSAKLFDSSEVIREATLQKYSSAGVTSAFINSEDRDTFQAYLQKNWDTLLADSTIAIESRLEVLSDVVRGIIDHQMHSGDVQRFVQASNSIAERTVELIGTNDVALSQLCSVLHHDYGTFTHSTNVSFYAVLLAKELGYDQDDQHEIAVGGLLHDIGKLAIDSKIINKPGPLNIREMADMKRHPVIGLERLANNPEVTFGQLMMTYQHHERISGSGYPCGLPGRLIHPYAAICAIVDVFEALTSHRPYRKPMEISAAMAILNKNRGQDFDETMLDAWVGLVNREEVYCA